MQCHAMLRPAKVDIRALQPVGKLSEFNDFGLGLAARFAFKGALVAIYLVGFDSGKPHRCAALGASWMFDFVMGPVDIRLLHMGAP
jgi:hypothetical protein